MPKSAKSEEPEEPRNPNCVYEDDYRALKPLFEALKKYPDLQKGVANAIDEYKAMNKPSLAA